MAIQRKTLECGCEIVIYGDGSAPPEVRRCPLHASAEELLAACKLVLALESSIDEEAWYASSQCPNAFRALRGAIKAAEGD